MQPIIYILAETNRGDIHMLSVRGDNIDTDEDMEAYERQIAFQLEKLGASAQREPTERFDDQFVTMISYSY